jgi:hypothetical protein
MAVPSSTEIAEPTSEAPEDADAGDPNQAVDDETQMPQYAGLMAVREPDRLVFFDLPSGKRQAFLLPQKLLDRRLTAYPLSADRLLIHAQEQGFKYWNGGYIVRLFWTTRDGRIEREIELKLAGWVPESDRHKAWRLAAMVPVPLGWLLGTTLGDPLLQIQANKAGDYLAALQNTFTAAWPPLVVVLAIGVLLSCLTIRFQRKYHRPATAAWSVFIFLFGISGFLAYWLEHRRPKMEACPECGQIVPRDRDVCAACRSPFAPALPVGTEIFA